MTARQSWSLNAADSGATETRLFWTETVPSSSATVEFPADSLWRLPERAEVRAESGRAVVTLRREGRNIVARADCDSLRRMCALLESRSAHYRAQRDTLQEELREERKRRGNPLRTFFTGLAAGILLTAGTLIFIKLRRKHSTN